MEEVLTEWQRADWLNYQVAKRSFSLTGQVLQEALCFCDGGTSSCWTEEGRR